jgi:elongation factor G
VRLSAASRHDRPCVPHAKDDHDGPHCQPLRAASCGVARSAVARIPRLFAKEGRIVSYNTENIRNIALAGHAGTGKTTLFEAMLHAGGVIQSIGSIERGTTQSDTDTQEKARGHSIDSCIAGIDHGSSHINLLDTAGYADFRGATLSAFAAVETALIVINASNGIEHGTRRMMEHARERGLARVIVINKIDADGVDLAELVRAIRYEFGNECLPVNLPADNNNRVLDCFFHKHGKTDFSSLAEAHQQISTKWWKSTKPLWALTSKMAKKP